MSSQAVALVSACSFVCRIFAALILLTTLREAHAIPISQSNESTTANDPTYSYTVTNNIDTTVLGVGFSVGNFSFVGPFDLDPLAVQSGSIDLEEDVGASLTS